MPQADFLGPAQFSHWVLGGSAIDGSFEDHPTDRFGGFSYPTSSCLCYPQGYSQEVVANNTFIQNIVENTYKYIVDLTISEGLVDF